MRVWGVRAEGILGLSEVKGLRQRSCNKSTA